MQAPEQCHTGVASPPVLRRWMVRPRYRSNEILSGEGCVGRTSDRGPPTPRIVVKESHLDHSVDIVPVSEHNQPKAMLLHILLQLDDLLSIELFLRVYHQDCSILRNDRRRSDARYCWGCWDVFRVWHTRFARILKPHRGFVGRIVCNADRWNCNCISSLSKCRSLMPHWLSRFLPVLIFDRGRSVSSCKIQNGLCSLIFLSVMKYKRFIPIPQPARA